MTNRELQADVIRQDGLSLRENRQSGARTRGQRTRAWGNEVDTGARALSDARYALTLRSTMDLGPHRNDRLGDGVKRPEARMQTALYNWGIAINLGVVVS